MSDRLLEILAVLNGDGGHYAVEHGVEAAFKRGLERHYAALAAAAGAHDDRLKQQTDWYQQRFNALRTWVNREVRPLSEEAAHSYFAIVANGSPAPHEQADWRDTMHGLTLRAESAERLLRTTENELANTRNVAAMETARANRMSDLLAAAEQEVERLRGLQPELPPRPPAGEGLPRYGLRWNGPDQPVAVPMDDGYRTPFHLAAAAAAVAADDLRASSASASRGWQMADELHLTVRDLTLRAEKAERGRDACAASRQLILEMYEEAVKERDLARAQATVPKPRTSGTGMCPYCDQPAGSSGCQRSHP